MHLLKHVSPAAADLARELTKGPISPDEFTREQSLAMLELVAQGIACVDCGLTPPMLTLTFAAAEAFACAARIVPPHHNED